MFTHLQHNKINTAAFGIIIKNDSITNNNNTNIRTT